MKEMYNLWIFQTKWQMTLNANRKFLFTLNQWESMGIVNERDMEQITVEESDVDIVLLNKKEKPN